MVEHFWNICNPKRLDSRDRNRMMKKLLLLLVMTSCSMSEVMEIEEPRMQADSTEYTPMEKGKRPSHDHDKKVPISFDVDVDDWGDEEEIPVEE